MGLGDADLLDDGDGVGGGGTAMAMALSCSICLEAVVDNGDRSWAKLQCGHQFHLDCIGSAFNIKGAMQCPNCRKIEKGQWLFANGSRPLPEFNFDDWAHDEDLYDLSYSEMPFGVHWCPFGGLTRFPASFEDKDKGDSEESVLALVEESQRHKNKRAYVPRNMPYSEGEFSSSASHPCPYITYFGPVHPSSTSSGSVSDGPSFNNPWSGPSVQNEVPSSYGFPSIDAHFHGWAHSPPFATGSRVGAADQTSIPSVYQRAARNGSNVPRPGMHPFIVGHSSGNRAPSSVTTSMLPPYPGIVTRPRDRVPSLQAYFPQSNNPPIARNPVVPTGRRSNSRRGLAQVVPLTSSSDQFYFFSSSSSGRTFQEAENSPQDQFYAWDRDYQPSLPLNQVDRDSTWDPFHPPAGGSETEMRSSGFRHRHGSERTPQNRP